MSVSLVPFIGVMYGALAFLAAMLVLVGSAGYFVHRKVGEHLVFLDRPIGMRLLMTTLAFLLAAGLILGIVFLTRLV